MLNYFEMTPQAFNFDLTQRLHPRINNLILALIINFEMHLIVIRLWHDHVQVFTLNYFHNYVCTQTNIAFNRLAKVHILAFFKAYFML